MLLRTHWNHLKIQYKFICASMLTLVIIIALFAGAAHFFISKTIREDVKQSKEKLIAQRVDMLNTVFHDVENVSRFLLSNRDILNMIKKSKEEIKYNDEKSFRETLASLSAFKDYIRAITIIGMEGNVLNYKDDYMGAWEYEKIMQSRLFQEAIERKGLYEWLVLSGGEYHREREDVIALCRIINDYDTIKPIGLLIIQISPKYLDTILLHSQSSENEILFLNYEKERTQPLYLGEQFKAKKETAQYDDFLSIEHPIEDTDFTLGMIYDSSEVSERQKNIYYVFIGILTTGALICFVGSYLVSISITKPIKELQKSMEQIEQNNWNTYVNFTGCDEVSALGNTFNHMISKINKSLIEVYNEKLLRQKSELSVLREQINPHFLYNTLDNLNWLAIANEQEDISKMLVALSRLFRISLSSGEAKIQIKDEIEHVRHYITIMEQRFPYILSVSIDAEQEIMDCKVEKIILQPIVENIFKHGLNGWEENASISIRVYRQRETILFEIMNTGRVIDLQKANSILSGDKGEKTFGIYNVHSRLSLAYGSEYGLSYQVGDNNETIAVIKIPYTEERKENE